MTVRKKNLVNVHNRKLTRREGKNEYMLHVQDKFCVMLTTHPGEKEIQVKRKCIIRPNADDGNNCERKFSNARTWFCKSNEGPSLGEKNQFKELEISS